MPGSLSLTDDDRAALDGERGAAARLAMRILTRTAEAMDAPHLLDVSSAHIDGCLYHGRAGLDFAQAARRRRSPGRGPDSPSTCRRSTSSTPSSCASTARRRRTPGPLMDAYVAMGCRPTWTCAPYQLPERPALGEHVAWAESNAIVFANSVLGARTGRYGDFIDICCAITGRAPAAGCIWMRNGSRGRCSASRVLPTPCWPTRRRSRRSVTWWVVARGTRCRRSSGSHRSTTEDHLKALGAAAASSGAVAMFHAIGVTPEAPTLDAATGGAGPDARRHALGPRRLRAARDELSTVEVGAAVGSVSLGTPHCSVAELRRLAGHRRGRRLAVPCYVNTGRDVTWPRCRQSSTRFGGGRRDRDRHVHLHHADHRAGGDPGGHELRKWAWYAPGNLGLDVAFATLEECVDSAEAGTSSATRRRGVRLRSPHAPCLALWPGGRARRSCSTSP